jgi:hypothetical protein
MKFIRALFVFIYFLFVIHFRYNFFYSSLCRLISLMMKAFWMEKCEREDFFSFKWVQFGVGDGNIQLLPYF